MQFIEPFCTKGTATSRKCSAFTLGLPRFCEGQGFGLLRSAQNKSWGVLRFVQNEGRAREAYRGVVKDRGLFYLGLCRIKVEGSS